MVLKSVRWSLVLALLAVCTAAAAEENSIELPVSFGKVWYRPAIKTGFGTGKQSGFLTVTAEGLEFSSKKRSDFLPWSRVEMVSYGRMSGDTDTKWVVLGLKPVAGERGYAGFRDGSRMGYGTATVPIFDAVIEGLRRAQAGPYEVSDGYHAYITHHLQFALALPEGWQAVEVSNTLSEGRPVWGRTIFSRRDLKEIRRDGERFKEALAEIADGSEPAIQLDRYEAGDGFSCEQLKKSGRRGLREEIARTLKPYRLADEPQWTTRPHRGCSAWTATASAERDGALVEVRFFAVSDGQTAYLFTVRAGAADDDGFDEFTRSLRTMVAR